MIPSRRERGIDLLLVDDDPGDVILTRSALKDPQPSGDAQGGTAASGIHEIVVARDGLEALEILRGEGAHRSVFRPHLILLDLNMPRMDGRAFLTELKGDASLRHTPVVVLTTSDAEPDIDQCYALHANCYVQKPVDLNQFAKVVKSIKDFWFDVAHLPTGAT